MHGTLLFQDSNQWSFVIEKNLFTFHHKINPEYQLLQSEKVESVDFDKWVECFPEDRFEYVTYYFKNSNTTLGQIDIVAVNGGIVIFPKPSSFRTSNGYVSYFYYKNSYPFYIKEIFSKFPSFCYGTEEFYNFFPVFNSITQACEDLEADSVKIIKNTDFIVN